MTVLIPVVLAAFVVAGYVWRGRWKLAAIASGSTSAVCAAGLLWPLRPFNASDLEPPDAVPFGVLYFPGDAPLTDVLLAVPLMLLVPVGLLWGAERLPGLRAVRMNARVGLRALRKGCVAIAVLVGLYAAGSILGRHFGEWGALKREIARHAARVSAAAPDARRLPTHQEFLELRARLMTPPATFRSAAFMEPLRIRMMEGGYPYVGVDYGAGRNAVFDPLTMVCTYSD